ncbi:uncharacterized protein LOC121969643 isoform X1 [Zingiber officinale]|uniref:uncharacterized protein LOC121969643 isoform X1 n=1 Tax=Zingiber officinale TaxID=94328 RepID=UPI001C4BB2C1|nr:uncharacterized protein LOC121969643 isoform X1 [Zingiber officinale]XP_042375778.1 uncharacterized protein LOC121969643 isoform X1 [Zingiber officinale]XP_042375779.1 uncharacterized protein LOC121969643 isoform X1 [Zingiber officinale]XP_042375780.1 uncharacterized protein LOC121969643 isoform X1 [Zingiber officinale]
MTCRMAAGQQKKRLTSSNIHEQFKGKKKRQDSSDCILNLRCHIDLEWDDIQRRVWAKKEQVGLSWTDITPFLDIVSLAHNGLADIIAVPQEMFSLDNLMNVLSYEVWATCLSESERKLLTQFLPSGKGAEQIVHSLLKGENHYFGNPFLKWSTSLCAGNLHPDNVLQAEQQSLLNKKAYYSEINKYHKGMLRVIKNWKEGWLNCKDPEKLWSDGYTKNKQGSLATSTEEANDLTISKRELRPDMDADDTDIYMSYIKVSKTQHQLVMNLKQSADGIQYKLLGRLLGDLNSFHVYPYITFEEEEKQKLHEHWLQMANKDLPAAFEVAGQRKMGREQMRKSLELELTEKIKILFVKDNKIQSIESTAREPTCDGDHRNQHTPDEIIRFKDNSTDEHLLDQITSLKSDMETSPIVVGQEVDEALQTEDHYSPLCLSVDNQNPSNTIMEVAGSSQTSAKNMWQSASISNSYYSTTENGGYTSIGQLSLGHPQLSIEHPTNIIGLGREIIEAEHGELMPTTFNADQRASLFSSYNQSEMLSAFPKKPRIISYPQQHINGIKEPVSQFLMTHDGLPESSMVSTQLQGAQQLEQRGPGEQDAYMHHITSKSLYSDSCPDQAFTSVEQLNFPSIQSSMDTGTLGLNWFRDDGQTYNNWSNIDPSGGGQCLADASNTEGSLYNVLSSKFPTCPSYSNSSSEQYLQPRNFGANSNAQNIYGYVQHQPVNPSSHQAVAVNNLSWMNYAQQNSSLHNPLGRPLQRSWNK